MTRHRPNLAPRLATQACHPGLLPALPTSLAPHLPQVAHATIDLSLEPERLELLHQLETSLVGGLAETMPPHSREERSLELSFWSQGLELPRIRVGRRLISFDEMQTLEDRGELDAILGLIGAS